MRELFFSKFNVDHDARRKILHDTVYKLIVGLRRRTTQTGTFTQTRRGDGIYIND